MYKELGERYAGIYQERKTSEIVHSAVNKAFLNREKSPNNKEVSINYTHRGIFESTDPRFSSVIVSGNRVVVDNLETYRKTLSFSFSKIVTDKDNIGKIADKTYFEMKAKSSKVNKEAEEVRYAVDFLVTPDGHSGLQPKIFTLGKYLPTSPEGITIQPRRQIDFISQHDPKFQYAVEAGIVSSPSDANLCWLAATEMALSPFMTAQSRDTVVRDLFESMKDSEKIGNQGSFRAKEINYLIEHLNKIMRAKNLSVEAKFYDSFTFDDLANKQRDGSTLLIAMSNPARVGHAMVISEILKEDGERAFFQVYDPSAYDKIGGSKVTDTFTIYKQHLAGKFRLQGALVTINSQK